MSKFMNVTLLGEGTKMILSIDHIFSVINKKDYRVIVMDLYDSPTKRKVYKVTDSYESICDRLIM